MIPVSLRLKGIYSYKDEQQIDFGPLSSAGLFGIFGPVGSGKSTILEAISFSIYGETERLNQREDRKYNMMNLKSDTLLIDFICRAGKGDDTEYRFTVSGKRTGKDFSKINTYDRGCYKRTGVAGEWLPVEERPEDIIGLSYENFRRTIIIPQGRFSEFLHLGGTDRSSALMEIFQLEKYDLDGKAKNVFERNRTELERSRTLLSQLEAISEEELEAAREALKNIQQQLASKEKECRLLEAQEKQQQETRQLYERLEAEKERLQELENEKQQWEQREQTLKRYRDVQLQFSSLLESRNATQRNLQTQQQRQEELNKGIAQKKEALQAQQQQFKTLEERYQQRDSEKEEVRKLKNIAAAISLEGEVAVLESRIKAGKEKIKKKEEALAKVRVNEKDLQSQIIELKKQQPDQSELSSLKEWYQRNDSIILRLHEIQDELAQCRKEHETLKQKRGEILGAQEVAVLLKDMGGNDPVEILKGLLETVKKQEEKLEAKREEVLLAQGLEQHAQHLHEGEECPICGSTRHPRLMKAGDAARKLEELRSEKEKLQAQRKCIDNALKELQIHAAGFRQVDNLLSSLEEKHGRQKEEHKLHREAWKWTAPYSPDNKEYLEVQFLLLENTAKELSEKESDIEAVREKIENEKTALERFNALLNELQHEIADKTGELRNLKAGIDPAEYERLKQQSADELQQQAEALEKEIAENEKQYRAQEQHIRQQQQDIAREEGQLGQVADYIKQLEQELKKLADKLEAQLQKSAYTSWEEVESLLQLGLDAEHEQQQINDYHKRLHNAQEKMNEYRRLLDGKTYDAEKHTQLQQQLSELNSAISSMREQSGGLKGRIEETEKQLAEKTKLQRQAEKLEKRDENIRAIRAMLKSKGFVNYVSSIYLDSLCQVANKRFRTLTRQQLELELDGNNQFQVRDYLNEGRLRHIKTLSGGQTFQAALSLALALADNTQKLAGRSQNFFFLDEGFGSLDRESLQVVMETLKFLQQENRVVGVISHVEELQQEMDVHLSISLHTDKGSMVHCSWEG